MAVIGPRFEEPRDVGLAMAKKDKSKAKPAEKADDSGIKIVARNRRARHDYELWKGLRRASY